MRLSVLLLLVTSTAACSDPAEVRTDTVRSTANAMAASWKEIDTWRGISIQMSLTASDTILQGSGTYSTTGHAGAIPSITGYVFWQDSAFVPSGHVAPAHPEVELDLAFDNGLSAHFDQGVLINHDTLRGALTFSDSTHKSYGTSFARETVQAAKQ